MLDDMPSNTSRGRAVLPRRVDPELTADPGSLECRHLLPMDRFGCLRDLAGRGQLMRTHGEAAEISKTHHLFRFNGIEPKQISQGLLPELGCLTGVRRNRSQKLVLNADDFLEVLHHARRWRRATLA